MMVEDVLDDGQAQPGAAHLARARRIDPIKSFRQAGQMLACDPFAIVTHRYRDKAADAALTSVARPRHHLCADGDLAPAASVFNRIVDKVLENLSELIAIAQHFGKTGRSLYSDAHIAFTGAQFQGLGDLMQQRG
jgi:hypothetical protein